MNRTISINISGLNFIIEEEAYALLQNYLTEIRNHCGPDTDVEEVISDIESGISEKLKSLLTSYKEVITVKDVESLIKIMGTKEDFDREVGDASSDEKEIPKVKRKLYRDTDDVVIGGVCSGIGNYFDVDPVLIRVVFFLLVFLSGVGVLAYIVLWIAMPEAKTANQKLEMRGEAPTVVAFEKLSKMEKKIKKNWKEKWSKYSVIEKIFSFPILIVSAFFDFIKKVFSKIGPVLRFIIGLFLILSSLAFFFVVGIGSLYMLLQLNSTYSIGFIPVSELIGSVPFLWLVISGFLSLSIPAIFFALSGLSLMRRKNIFSIKIGIIFLSIWMLACVSFCSLALRYTPDVVSKVKSYPSVQIISTNIDASNTKKLSINGDDIIVEVLKDYDDKVTLNGRIIDLSNINIVKENDSLSISQIDMINESCISCHNDTVTLVIDSSLFSEIKLGDGVVANIPNNLNSKQLIKFDDTVSINWK